MHFLGIPLKIIFFFQKRTKTEEYDFIIKFYRNTCSFPLQVISIKRSASNSWNFFLSIFSNNRMTKLYLMVRCTHHSNFTGKQSARNVQNSCIFANKRKMYKFKKKKKSFLFQNMKRNCEFVCNVYVLNFKRFQLKK